MDNKTFLIGESLSTSILAKAESLAGTTTGQHNFYLTGSNYTGDDLPHSNYTFSVASVFVRSTFLVVVVWGVGNLLPIFNGYDGSKTWRGWQTLVSTADLTTALAKYLPLTGGTVNGNIEAEATDTSQRAVAVKNSLRRVSHFVSTDGAYSIYDSTNGKNIIRSEKDGTNTFNGTASGNLPLTGGKLSGNVTIESDAGNILYELKNSNRNISLGVYPNGNAVLYDLTSSKSVIDMPLNSTNTFNGKATGNGNPVHIGTSAPSDTSALWIDTGA